VALAAHGHGVRTESVADDSAGEAVADGELRTGVGNYPWNPPQ